MTDKNIKIYHALTPLSYLYGWGVALRNKLFDRGWLRSKSFDIPIICVGNLAVGGTGKTPHTEYLIRLLQAEGLHIATLSRGYKRKTKGYLLADADSNASHIGDEPYQMKQKFPHIRVSVCADRCHGVEQLLQLQAPTVDVILLDDAFQHRYIKAGLNILLTDYSRLFCDDALLPAGKLREHQCSKRRAELIIVTKCPDDITSTDISSISKRLNLLPHQQLYFSRFSYGTLSPLFPEEGAQSLTLDTQTQVLLLTGIVSPTPMVNELKKHTPHVKLLAYGDHYDFQDKDLIHIEQQFMQLNANNRMIVTTEKDAARLRHHPALSETLKKAIYVWPIEIELLEDKQDSFNKNIIDYVRKNPRNCSLPKS